LDYYRGMLERLEKALSGRQKQRITDAGRTPSAVLLPVYCKQEQYHLLFTRRTETVKYHKGQISFPGGTYEEGDGTLFDTALREGAEEIGLAADGVELLGELDDTVTSTSSYIISPFVVAIPWPYPFKVNRSEIDEIIEVPIPALMDENCLRRGTELIDGKEFISYFYNYRGKVIWGATARILHQFLQVVSGVME
jgi:8-oxo-dGTP pyrophosphatase MutT (NUDIX family)